MKSDFPIKVRKSDFNSFQINPKSAKFFLDSLEISF